MRILRTAPLVFGLILVLFASGAEAGDAQRPGVPDDALQKAINDAIRRGADYLVSVQKTSGMIGGVAHRKGFSYNIGTTALAGLALLAARENEEEKTKNKPKEAWSAAADKALAYCKRQDALRGGAGTRTTYDTGVLLMFVARYYRGAEKPGKVRKRGTVTARDRGNPCKFPEDVRKWVGDMAMWLQVITAYDAIFLVVSFWVFSFVIEE